MHDRTYPSRVVHATGGMTDRLLFSSLLCARANSNMEMSAELCLINANEAQSNTEGIAVL